MRRAPPGRRIRTPGAPAPVAGPYAPGAPAAPARRPAIPPGPVTLRDTQCPVRITFRAVPAAAYRSPGV